MDYQTSPLTPADRQLIKQEKRLGNTFLYIFTGLSLILLIFITYFKPIVYIAAALLVVGVVTSRLINRKYNIDLSRGQKHIYLKEIEELMLNPKVSDTARLIAPDFHRMSNFHAGYGVKAGNLVYLIDQTTYQRLQNQTHCLVHYAPVSNTFLGVYPID